MNTQFCSILFFSSEILKIRFCFHRQYGSKLTILVSHKMKGTPYKIHKLIFTMLFVFKDISQLSTIPTSVKKKRTNVLLLWQLICLWILPTQICVWIFLGWFLFTLHHIREVVRMINLSITKIQLFSFRKVTRSEFNPFKVCKPISI